MMAHWPGPISKVGGVTHRHFADQLEITRQGLGCAVGIAGFDGESIYSRARKSRERMRRENVFGADAAQGRFGFDNGRQAEGSQLREQFLAGRIGREQGQKFGHGKGFSFNVKV
jgi:hypothetical protein